MTSGVKRHSFLRMASSATLGSGLMLLAVAGAVSLERLSDAGEAPSVVPIDVDFAAPVLGYVDLAGNPSTLLDLQPHEVLVNLWATWCPPCVAEMPVLAAAAREHASQGLVVLALNQGESQHAVSGFIEPFGPGLIIGLDPHEEAMRRFGTTALPSTYYVDAQGQVRLAWFGAIDRDHLEAALDRVEQTGGLP